MSETLTFDHTGVMLTEAVDALNIRPDGLYIDATLGGGGHSVEIVKKLKNGRLLGIDRDGDALEAAKEKLKPYSEKITFVRDRFSHIKEILDNECNGQRADGILMDLGVSSYQLDSAARGFSYIHDAQLDMRMDDRQVLNAATIINTYSKEALANMIARYGEDKFANNIAKKIAESREKGEITTTKQLADIIDSAYPAKFKVGRGHPAKKTFQALRIECNSELEELKTVLDTFEDCMAPSGRIVIITFHSLEDRLVKNKFKRLANPCECPAEFAVCVCNKIPKGRIITKKPIIPTDEEMNQNKRSKSSKLRVFEML